MSTRSDLDPAFVTAAAALVAQRWGDGRASTMEVSGVRIDLAPLDLLRWKGFVEYARPIADRLAAAGPPPWNVRFTGPADLSVYVPGEPGGTVRWGAGDDDQPPAAVVVAHQNLLADLVGGPDAWTALDVGWDPTFERSRPLTVVPFGDVGPQIDAAWRQAATRTPDVPAVIHGDGILTRGRLARWASEIAHRLAEAGVRAGEPVLVAAPKGPAQIAAVLGVCGHGAAYVPVDPAWPAARIAEICERAGIRFAVVTDEMPIEIPDGIHVVSPAEGGTSFAGQLSQVSPDELAYVIFTSGSTGTPKGVAIEHRQARTTIDDITDRFGITERDRVLGLSALTFDLSVYDIFGVLGAGGVLVLPDHARQREPRHWCELIGDHEVTVWNTAPALLEILVEHAETDRDAVASLRTLRLVMLSGDWIPVTLPDRLRTLVPDVVVMSLGGATEASIWSITYPVTKVDPSWPSVPYGRPLRGQSFHILDEEGRPSPVGVPGDLYIGGDGLARGYIGDPAQTAQRWRVHDVLGERLYHTGDLGQWRQDGTIQFLGRTDRQVKVHGHRIELGEIESVLDRLPQVRKAVAATVPGPGNRPLLVAYVVPHSAMDDAPGFLAAALAERVPDYMVPSRFVVMSEIPVTANGKVDHRSLPNPFRRPSRLRSAGVTRRVGDERQ